jgi:anti-sigma B factor antagonist
MDIEITDLPEVTRAALHGRLDTANVNQGEAAFIDNVVAKGRAVVVDLREVSFIASLGIRMLLSAARTLARSGVKMALYGATPLVIEIIETTALDEIIPVVATEAEAVALVTG